MSNQGAGGEPITGARGMSGSELVMEELEASCYGRAGQEARGLTKIMERCGELICNDISRRVGARSNQGAGGET